LAFAFALCEVICKPRYSSDIGFFLLLPSSWLGRLRISGAAALLVTDHFMAALILTQLYHLAAPVKLKVQL
jgi:hypothetical protein